jgi:hypothetical protein
MTIAVDHKLQFCHWFDRQCARGLRQHLLLHRWKARLAANEPSVAAASRASASSAV